MSWIFFAGISSHPSSPWRDWNGGWSGGRCWRGTQLLQFCRLHRVTLGVGWGWRNDLRGRDSAFLRINIVNNNKSLNEFWALSGGNQWRLNYTLNIRLMEEILHHLGCINPCKSWDKLPINWCRISSINSICVRGPTLRWSSVFP